MPVDRTPIVKSAGVTRTERLLADLCERTFHTLWSYPNPYKDDSKELCDLIVVFGDHVLLFFDRESRRFDGASADVFVTWERWRKEAVDKQIKTAVGAERYIRRGRAIYLDGKRSTPFPVPIPENARIHKFVVAHGAKEACEAFSEQNVSGSLAVAYGMVGPDISIPFMLHLSKEDIVHVLDSHTLEVLFLYLDTMYDFIRYVDDKERAILEYRSLIYCGEEDLLAHYILNYNELENKYRIGPRGEGAINGLFVAEGGWQSLVATQNYQRRLKANEVSHLWDGLIQKTCENALEGILLGNADLFGGKSAIHEMAKEPRFSRRALSDHMVKAINNFPATPEPFMRHVSLMPSFYQDVGYVFLQLKCLGHGGDSDERYQAKRRALLSIACGAARNKFPELTKVVGIAIDAPKFHEETTEDFMLMECENWSSEEAAHYSKLNEDVRFFGTEALTVVERTSSDFPTEEGATGRGRPGT